MPEVFSPSVGDAILPSQLAIMRKNTDIAKSFRQTLTDADSFRTISLTENSSSNTIVSIPQKAVESNVSTVIIENQSKAVAGSSDGDKNDYKKVERHGIPTIVDFSSSSPRTRGRTLTETEESTAGKYPIRQAYNSGIRCLLDWYPSLPENFVFHSICAKTEYSSILF